MITTVERRSVERGRIPFEIPVELLHEDFDDAFEADAVDVSPGGLSLRSSCLPEIGEQLLCSFETVPGGTRVSSRGEVVWTHLAGVRGGEFGVRFVDQEPQTRALIAEMVAERAVQTERAADAVPSERAADSCQPPMAQLDLEGVDAPLHARLMHAGGGAAVFEQRLDLLELGRAVVAHAGSALGRGNIAEVGLRMDGDTPLLTVTVRFDGGKSLFGEFDWETKASPATDTDTVPDLDAPSLPQQLAQGAEEPRVASVTMTEFCAQPEASQSTVARQTVSETNASAGAETETLPAALGDGLTQDEVAQLASDAAAAQSDEQERAARQEVRRSQAAEARAHDEEMVRGPQIVRTAKPAPKQSEQDSRNHDAWAHPLPEGARSSVLVRFLRIFAAVVVVTQRAGTWLKSALWPSTRKLLAELHIERAANLPQRLWTSSQHLTRNLLARASARPRRTTTAPAALRKAEQATMSSMRLAVLAGLAISAIALGVYALLPSPEEEQIPLHRSVQVALRRSAPSGENAATTPREVQPSAASPSTASSAAVATSAPANAGNPAGTASLVAPTAPTVAGSLAATAAPAQGSAALNPAYARSMAGQPPLPSPATAAPSPQPAPPSAAVPRGPASATLVAASPYAVDVREPAHVVEVTRKPATPANAPGPSFGAKAVPNAQRFVLHMTGTIKTLQGSGDRSGFTVVVPGSRALDRAGPIRASHKAVAQAMVLNKGDHAELTIRFVEHKHPAYRVSGHGSELEVLIAP